LNVALSAVSKWVRDEQLTDEEKRIKVSAGHKGPKPLPEAAKYWEFLSKKQVGSAQIGRIAEAAILFRLCVHGFDVFGSVFEGHRVDWLVQNPSNKRIIRIQVKATDCYSYGWPHINLRRTISYISRDRRECENVRYAPGDFDFIVGYDARSDIAYVYSEAEVVGHRRSVTVSPEAAERWDKLSK
jgi:hypothetical protein